MMKAHHLDLCRVAKLCVPDKRKRDFFIAGLSRFCTLESAAVAVVVRLDRTFQKEWEKLASESN